MKQRILLILAFVFVGFTTQAQVSTASYNTLFQTQDQSLWQTGASGVIEINHELFGFDWDEGGTFGDVTSIAGQQFGAEVTAGTWGDIGSGLTINFGSEKVDINYNSDMEIEFPSIASFQAGDQLVLNTDWAPNSSNSYIMPDSYDMNIGLWLRMGMGVDLSANLCAFGCTDYDFIDLDMNTTNIDLVEVSSATGLTLMNGLVNYPANATYPVGFFPIIYSDPTGIMTLNLDMPHNTGGTSASHFVDGDLVYNSTYHYFNMHLSIPKLIGALHIPYVSAVVGNLSNSWTTGPFYLNYTVMEAGFDLGLYNNQRLRFEPEMHGQLDFPALVDYQVVNPMTGAVIESGVDSVINYTPGEEIRIDFPCQYDFMDVSPSYSMTNEFSNHTYDSIAFDFLFDMLAFNVGIQSLVVIPEICVPIYVPCGPWYCPVCDWCRRGSLCTPAVEFNGYNAGFGPLVHWQPNLFNTSYDWKNGTWEMGGFNEFDNLAPIRLEPAKFDVTTTHTDVLCYGDETGDATAFVSNGRPPYTYEWSNGESQFTHQTTLSVDELEAGTHYVSVTDANGCMVFASFVVEQPLLPLSATAELTDVSCHGFSDGQISLTAVGGTSPYNYSWSNGVATALNDALVAGEYTITITDANGCTYSESYTINQPYELTAEIVETNVLCSGENSGMLEAMVSGGISPYTYNWSNGSTEGSQSDLPAGNYNLTVTDFNSCSVVLSATINEPAEPLAVLSNVNDVLCHGESTGSIELTISGGTTPYVCNWYNAEGIWLNETSGVLTELSAGTYSVEVLDANNCSESLELTVTEPDAFDYSMTLTHVLCYGESTGAIELDLTGATAPYSYVWSNGVNTEDLSEIPAGNYTLTVTDAHGCQYQIEAEITQPETPLVSEISIQDVLCYGDKTGAISVLTQGGTEPYTYEWNNGLTDSSLENLEAGVYTVTVTDGNACQHYTGGEIKQPEAPLTLESSITDAACFSSADGEILLTINGGTLPYRVVWDDQEYLINNNLHSLKNLGTGSYHIEVLDANNCYIHDDFFVNQPEDVSIVFETGMVSCFGGEDGYANTEVAGGTSPYSYEWSNGSLNENLTSAAEGHYYLTITDAKDCQYEADVEVESYPEILLSYELREKTCIDVDDASIETSATGGTEEFVYQWSTGATTSGLEDLAVGFYTLTLTDGNYCEKIIEVEVPESMNECLNIPSTFTPNGDGINDTWVLRNIFAYPDATIQVYAQTGSIVFESMGAYEPWDGKYNGEKLPAAVYYYIVNLNDGTEPFTGTVTILR